MCKQGFPPASLLRHGMATPRQQKFRPRQKALPRSEGRPRSLRKISVMTEPIPDRKKTTTRGPLQSDHQIPKRRSTKNGRKRDASQISSNNPMHRSEHRRLKRVAQRQENTICFICREKGHAAKDCTKAVVDAQDKGGKKVVGICYRCGSTRHTLSRCKKPEDPLNPLPFASCFVCSLKGHLASSCPKNTDKGIYPNGGCCKLCGQKTHLAKDCELRKRDQSGTAVSKIFGIGKEAGADEDDFHVFKRKNAEVSNDEKDENKQGNRAEVQAGVHVDRLKRRLPGTPAKVQKSRVLLRSSSAAQKI
ncbi:hypothetical protein F5J12DRAFT_203900 [Pisolithus orientalis]|uniref:uncharacterized protein n=1 Tax=Pisolithus orientalis TaxID=936130 RepID=UPI002223F147|nr:uncharacterized protein F5J12DRAFT_203900 [Pisolithus orientalis]KAI6033238.1 hypothetical protein F5J12DRAFT_203900 [Pisolithus orientalis]